jgi:hypothetical protein
MAGEMLKRVIVPPRQKSSRVAKKWRGAHHALSLGAQRVKRGPTRHL